MIYLPEILPQPKERPTHVSNDAKWLSGEGAGSWFVIKETKMHFQYQVTRYSPEGEIECQELFYPNTEFSLKKEFEITYPAHCAKVSVIQENKMIFFCPIKNTTHENL